MNTEEFWKGEFGDEYATRQEDMVENNREFFSRILYSNAIASEIDSVVEFGAGTGMNTAALHKIMGQPPVRLTSVEINREAAEKIPHGNVYIGSMFDFKRVDPPADLAFTKGLLIHIPPEKINIAYDILYNSSNKYILIAEYYNPTPVEVEYRGHQGRLWKRDFCGEIMQRYPQLALLDYGFVYHKDLYPQDDITWFLLEKTRE